ncbi:MAG TPA: protein kinase, partial [Vicinamibacteria bacterium]
APSPLAPGETLGRFVVRGVLGEGGMGRVYRALDPSLGREVAIKAVARDFRDDAGSLRRFEREARLLATLNHPNVGAIYGFELIDGAPYLVLELVEGETLAERLRRGALPLGEALTVGVQVADALQEAHKNGIVHRDLKPSNIKLGEAGRVKVLDFGIAKPLSPPAPEDASPPEDPTTLPGTLLGTAPYMSPEQVRGLPVDTRSDVWSFGCVLYEMLTGRRAFGGKTSSDVLAAVLRDEPDLDALPRETPRGVRRLLRRCLRKDARDRQQDAGDARLELTEAATDDPPASVAEARSWPAWGLGVLMIAALVVAGLALRSALLPPAAGRVLRLSLDLPSDLTLADAFASPFELSRDGSSLVLAAREGELQHLFVRPVGQITPARLPGTEGAWQPTFAPDGRAVAFFADRKLRVARLGTGEVLTLAEIGGNPRGAAWADDGTIVLSPTQTSPLLRLPATGGPLTSLTRLDEAAGEVSHRWPQAIPGSPFVLFTAALQDRSYDEARLEVVSLETGERRRILEGGAHGRVLESGHLVFARSGRLLAVPFDLGRLAVRGTPEVVVDGVRYEPQNGGTHVAVAGEGTFIYTPGAPTSPERGLAVVDPAGQVTRVVSGLRLFREPRISPDGQRVAVVIAHAGESDLWLLDLGSGTLSQLTFGLSPRRPTWRPDGR